MKPSEAKSGNWYDSPWQPVREGIKRVLLAGSQIEGATLSVAVCENGNEVRPHTHPHAQMAIVLKGTCDFYVDGVCHAMRPGSWIYIPGGVEHCIDVHDSEEPVENLDIFFPSRMEYVDEYDKFVAGLEK